MKKINKTDIFEEGKRSWNLIHESSVMITCLNRLIFPNYNRKSCKIVNEILRELWNKGEKCENETEIEIYYAKMKWKMFPAKNEQLSFNLKLILSFQRWEMNKFKSENNDIVPISKLSRYRDIAIFNKSYQIYGLLYNRIGISFLMR